MSKKVSIHQPQYLPYPGFFNKVIQSDIFVVLDNTQYDQRFTNRNKILTSTGTSWLTIPIDKHQHFKLNRDVEIHDNYWQKTHWKSIVYSYSISNYFHLYHNFFETFYKQNWKNLFDLNYNLLTKILEWLNIDVKVVKESDLQIEGKQTERLINICHAVNAETYISGIGGKNYLDVSKFDNGNVSLIYQDYTASSYKQNFTDNFIPNLSIIDLLFNMGPETLKVITGKPTP